MMSIKERHGHRAIVFALGAVFLMIASVAWACSPAVNVETSENAGPAGTLVEITGRPGVTDRPVEIRWNSATGALLATVPGSSSFSVAVKIPENAEPGVYYFIAEGRAIETFQVTGPEGAVPARTQSSDSWSGFSATSEMAIGEVAEIQGDSAPATSLPLQLGMGLTGIGFGGLILSSVFLMQKRVRALSS